MIHLTRRLAAADLLGSPVRSAAVTTLLVCAAWLPAVVGSGPGYGVALAAVVAFCATLGALAVDDGRTRLLEQNGARRLTLGILATASMVAPGLVATVIALGIGLVVDGGPSALEVAAVALLVPVLTAPIGSVQSARPLR